MMLRKPAISARPHATFALLGAVVAAVTRALAAADVENIAQNNIHSKISHRVMSVFRGTMAMLFVFIGTPARASA